MYKLNEDGKLVDGEGKEVTAEGLNTMVEGFNTKFETVTTESNDRRKKLGAVTTELAAATGSVVDMQATIDAFDEKGKTKLEEYKNGINKVWEDKQAEWEVKEKALNVSLFDATVGAKFATSKVVSGTVLPPDIAKATFGSHFKADGSATDASGNTLLSKIKPGTNAGFDEALTMIIDARPDKDSILKASDSHGSGGHNQGGGNGGNQENSSFDNIKEGLKTI